MLTLDKGETKQSLILAERSNLGARVWNTGKILRGLHTEHTHTWNTSPSLQVIRVVSMTDRSTRSNKSTDSVPDIISHTYNVPDVY